MLLYILCQISGSVTGAYVAHAMFMLKNDEFRGAHRDTDGEMFSEMIATFGLFMTIFGGIKHKKDVPLLVGLYITSGYWFTSSTSFANPAVTLGRTFTNTFASISPKSLPKYFFGQFVGFVVGFPTCVWLFEIQLQTH